MLKVAETRPKLNSSVATKSTLKNLSPTMDQRLSEFEQTLEKIFNPIKPFLPILARFLLVVTFLEDSVRIMTQFDDQAHYLVNYQSIQLLIF